MSRARDFADLASSSSNISTVAADSANLDQIASSYSAGGITGKNLIINGAMQVHQRGNQSVSSGNRYSLDRWEVATTGGSAAYDLQQSTDVPTGQGFGNSFKLDVTTADIAMGAGDGYIFRQSLEGQNVQSIKKGTSNAEQVTVQFWVKSTKTGTYIIELYDLDNTRQVSKAYTVSSADTWEYKTVTFPADTSGAMDNNNARSLILQWWLAAGTNFTSGTLNTTWASATSANRVVGQVNVLDNTSNNFHVVGVQMELGETATPFEHRSFGDELRRCQRYYQKSYNYEHAPGNTTNNGAYQFFHPSSTIREPNVRYETEMRVNPTETFYAPDSGTSGKVRNRSTNADETAVIGDTGSKGFNLSMSITANNHYGFHYTADAEL